MSELFFYTDKGSHPNGPVSLDELRQLAERKRITATALIAQPGDAGWRTWTAISAEQLRGIQASKPDWAPPSLPAQTANPFWSPPTLPNIAETQVSEPAPQQGNIPIVQSLLVNRTSKDALGEEMRAGTTQPNTSDPAPTAFSPLSPEKLSAPATVLLPTCTEPASVGTGPRIEQSPHPLRNTPESLKVDLDAPRPELSPEAKALIRAVDSPINWAVVIAVAVVFLAILGVAAWSAACQNSR